MYSESLSCTSMKVKLKKFKRARMGALNKSYTTHPDLDWSEIEIKLEFD